MREWWQLWKPGRVCNCVRGERCFVCCVNVNSGAGLVRPHEDGLQRIHELCAHRTLDRRVRNMIRIVTPTPQHKWKS